jgi:RND family efflux transporter MFP subunit
MNDYSSMSSDLVAEQRAPQAWWQVWRPWLIWPAVVAVLGGLWFALHHKADEAKGGQQAPIVSVIVPGRAHVAGTINATGLLAAKHDMPIASVGEGGQVTQVLVNAGDWVKQGQLLVVIDRSVQVQQDANLQAMIRVSEADARLAQANLDRAMKLVDRGFISKANIDELTATRDAANARVRVAQANLGETRARMRRLTIVAPADGLVLDRMVEPGQVVGAGTGTLLRIAEHGDMEMRAKLSETDLAHMKVGQAVQVQPVGTDQTLTGHVWQISPVIDALTRQGLARIQLAYSPAIRPGGFAGAVVESGMVQAPVLPESALQADAKGSYVYVIGPNNKAQRRGVTIGQVTPGGVIVTGGLAGDERVVLRAGAFLTAGETVVPQLIRGQ